MTHRGGISLSDLAETLKDPIWWFRGFLSSNGHQDGVGTMLSGLQRAVRQLDALQAGALTLIAAGPEWRADERIVISELEYDTINEALSPNGDTTAVRERAHEMLKAISERIKRERDANSNELPF